MKDYFIPKYCDANSILLVNRKGKVRKLYCPFKVKALNDINNLKRNRIYWVEHVGTFEKQALTYNILGTPFLFKYFEIIASF